MEQTTDIKHMSLFKLGWPIFVQALLSMCLGYIDTLMISRYSESAVGGIGNANQIGGFLTLAFTIISSATGIITAQYLGAKMKDKLNQIYTISMAFNLILSLIISALILIFHTNLFHFMKVQKSMIEDASSYISIVGGFIFLEAIFDIFSQIFRSNGKTKIGMVISIIMNVVNIIGNYTFLYGPLKYLNLGVKGVALSTTVSRLIAVVIAMIYFHKKIEGSIRFKYLFPFNFEIFKQLLMIGLPTAGENISYNIAQLILLMFVNTLSVTAVNTRIYANILGNFSYLFSISAAMATAIVVGHLVGAGENDTAYQKVLDTLKKAMIISIIIAVINYFIAPVTFGIFSNNNQAVMILGQKIMFICIFLEIGRCTNLVVINSMKAAGDIRFPTFLGMASMWGISVLFGYIFGIHMGYGLEGIWVAMALDEIVRGIIVFIRWIHGSWRGKKIV